MSRQFQINQNGIVGSSIISTTPVTMSIWWRSGVLNDPTTAICVGQYSGGDNKHRIVIREDTTDVVQCATVEAGSGVVATSTSSLSLNTWYNLTAVFASSTSRAIYINGGSKGTNTTSKDPSGMNRIVIAAVTTGSGTYTQYGDGQMAHAAIWNVALTDTEVLLLSKFSPLLVHPQSLVFYAPLRGRNDPEIELCNSLNLILNGSPAYSATDPAVILPSSTQYGLTIPSAPATSPYMTTNAGYWGPL